MIEVSELRKRYGATQSLDGMTFRVLPGQVTGFVGPNGAGKSTTMRIILGLDAADAGTAMIGGRPYRTLRHPLSHVGALLDAAALQPSRTARNHLLWLAHSQGLDASRVDTPTLYHLTDLGRSLDEPIAALEQWNIRNWSNVEAARRRWNRRNDQLGGRG